MRFVSVSVNCCAAQSKPRYLFTRSVRRSATGSRRGFLAPQCPDVKALSTELLQAVERAIKKKMKMKMKITAHCDPGRSALTSKDPEFFRLRHGPTAFGSSLFDTLILQAD